MHSTTFRNKVLAVAVACLSFCVVPSLAQDELIKTAATKSDSDDKPLADKPAVDEAHPLFKLLEVAYKSRKALDAVDDYQCIFTKREVLPNNKLLKTTMSLKLRENPFSVYLKFMDLNAGREVIFVKGQNNNNMLVHEAGVKSFLGTFPIPPTGPDALAENKYPVTSIGLRKMINTIITQWELEGKFDGTKTQKFTGSKLGNLTCTVYEASHEKPFKEFKFCITRLWIDDETGLAIGVQQYAFPGKPENVLEEYFYTQLKLNPKLTNVDFDPKNPKYEFR